MVTRGGRGTVRHGFTLIELLVAMAIIAVLVTLLMPAMQTAREAARRSVCYNRLQQMGRAAHVHHEAEKFVPPGVDEEGWPWSVWLLPYLEYKTLWDAIDPDNTTYPAASDPENTLVPAYVCPSDIGGEINTYRNNYYKANYGGVFGDNPPSRLFGPGSLGTGPMIFYRQLKFADILDGLSNTLLIGERGFYVDNWDGRKGGTWLISQASGIVHLYGVLCPANDAEYALGTIDSEWTGFNSYHDEGSVNFLLCDGSVHSVSRRIDPVTFKALTDNRGGVPANWP
jgi:prepilin-type N-terminal cleavage/methylation domain-containing protein/prepilin-type processing-associated H-X9-DG protein